MKNEEIIDLLNSFKEGYMDRLNFNLSFLNDEEKKSLPFFRSMDYLGLVIINTGPLNKPYKYITLITNNIESNYLEVTNFENENLKRISAENTNPEVKAKLLVQEIIDEIDLDSKISPYIDYLANFELTPNSFIYSGNSYANQNYLEILENKNSRIIDNSKPKFNPFSFLDFDGIIKKVNDSDFSYQMEEAKICYENQLYLAATCTFSVCLETVLMLIIDKHGLKIDDNSTMLNKIGDTLRNKNIISKRANNRLLVTYSVRNSTSHTNKNKVILNDCEWILKTIEFFVDEYLD